MSFTRRSPANRQMAADWAVSSPPTRPLSKGSDEGFLPIRFGLRSPTSPLRKATHGRSGDDTMSAEKTLCTSQRTLGTGSSPFLGGHVGGSPFLSSPAHGGSPSRSPTHQESPNAGRGQFVHGNSFCFGTSGKTSQGTRLQFQTK
eukprot:CAMPEP_0173130200 /NCGR_PEP_ID=MMETSP1102-20130122/59802_1 /TAXON_ID=49646 /ORGANISM="Geminigera sp., Strain Caron Lab Isolate" /LENGTH=144 /DNA_ID=CAMNT_0014041077 /DNA_START=127 /DNA_END=561 /DNA_ORIENTATION=-